MLVFVLSDHHKRVGALDQIVGDGRTDLLDRLSSGAEVLHGLQVLCQPKVCEQAERTGQLIVSCQEMHEW